MAVVKNNSNKDKTPTPHNAAKKGQIAPTVLLPGDPQRAEWIAKEFLTGAKLVTDILDKYPAGTLPPIDKMTQRNKEDIEAVIKGPNEPGGRHIYTLEY